MYNRPYFTPWVNAKKFVVQIPLIKDEPPEYDLASPEAGIPAGARCNFRPRYWRVNKKRNYSQETV